MFMLAPVLTAGRSSYFCLDGSVFYPTPSFALMLGLQTPSCLGERGVKKFTEVK